MAHYFQISLGNIVEAKKGQNSHMNQLAALIDSMVEAYPKPAILLGGGIDSAVIGYHLTQKTDNVHSFTFTFPTLGYDDSMIARKIANHLGTQHHTVEIERLLPLTREALRYLPKPRFNVWLWKTAELIRDLGLRNLYTGEGGDEAFGGYWYKPPTDRMVEWAGLYIWGLETYQMIYERFGINMHYPYLKLPIMQVWNYYDPERRKQHLREAYRGLLPDWIVDRVKIPGGPDQQLLWENELSYKFPKVKGPLSNAEIRYYWNVWTMKEWLKLHGF